VAIAVILGASIGLLAGYRGGKVDDIVMRFVDAVQAFPGLILALALTAALGPGIGNVMIAVGFISAPAMARLTRAQTLSVRESEYVAAARVLGAPPRTIVLRHIWPNVTAPIIVQSTLLVATAIVTEASLSFLGVGVQPPTPSWGSMLRTGSQYLEVAPWIAFAPGVAIFLTVLAFNVIGDGLRRVLDPRLASRQRG
jgi:ABC-type dipeptide/oligopeptide/nickel transport system permease subunit